MWQCIYFVLASVGCRNVSPGSFAFVAHTIIVVIRHEASCWPLRSFARRICLKKARNNQPHSKAVLVFCHYTTVNRVIAVVMREPRY
jgi:hypothetical protein